MQLLSRIRFWQATTVTLAVALAAAVALLATGSAAGAGAPGDAIRAGIALDEFEIVLPDHPLAANSPLRLDVTNLGELPHDLVIDDVAATEVLDPGESATLELGALAPGVYRVHCDVEGHADAGMVAELWVGDAKSRAHEH